TGDWSRGFRGLAALSSCKTEFRESVDTAIHYAKTLKCDKIHVMAGIPTGSEPDVPKLFIDNVAYAAEKFGKADIMCLIEPINHYTVPGYFLSSYEQAKEVIDAVKLPNLKIQYDVFHAQQICGQISATIKKYKELIGYIQIAQVLPVRDGKPKYNGVQITVTVCAPTNCTPENQTGQIGLRAHFQRS
ncbi:hydroxypyruvate isomerase domain protein, partial [Ostertagia ostertagi]